MITAEQRQRRRQGIGGSDAAPVVLGADDYQTRLDVYSSKVFDLPDETDPIRERGNKLEPVIRELAADELGVAIVPAPLTYVHPSRPWMIAHLDGLVADGGLLEAKAIDWRKAREQLGEPGTDFCAPSHFLQTQHQMEVTGLPFAHVAYFVSTFDLRLFVVMRDREIGGMIAAAEERFWNDHVLARVPPEVDDVDAQLRYRRARLPSALGPPLVVTPGTSAYDAMRDLRDARRAKADAVAIEKACVARVQALMGDARKISCDLGAASWGKPGTSTAWREVARDLHADRATIAKHTKPAGRRFLPRFTHDDAPDDGADEE